MKCDICGKYVDETYRGVYEKEVVNICRDCAQVENIPLIKKPTPDQIHRANQRYSVRETMEKISGFNKLHTFPQEHATANKNLAKLRIPVKRPEPVELVPNYHWKMQMARRNSKLTIGEVSRNTGIPQTVIINLEKGIPPKDFEPVVEKLESFLMIRLLKRNEGKKFDQEMSSDELLGQTPQEPASEPKQEEKKKWSLKNFFKRKKLDTLTLDELADYKKQKDAAEKGNMTGSDVELK